MGQFDLFHRYVPQLRRLPAKGRFAKRDLLTKRFRLGKDGKLSIYYAPVEGMNRRARVALVGLTPGWTQMELAYRVAVQALREGLTAAGVSTRVKRQVPFAGGMRTSLVTMLDGIGIAKALKVRTTALLFEREHRYLHSTSALRYPVFVDGANYTGNSPSLKGSPLLKEYVLRFLASELAMVRDALIIPLGRAASTAVEWVVEEGYVMPERCVFEFPHPSGANGHRWAQFSKNRRTLRSAVSRWFGAS